MAIFRPGGLAGSISGAAGGVVFVNGRSGPVLRRRPSGRPRVTEALQAARGMPGRIAAAWNELTELQRQAWRTAAAALRFPNRLGVLRAISGYQLYTRHVMDVYLGSPPAALAPPSASMLYSPTTCTAYFLEGGPYALTTWGLPLGGTVPVEYAYVQLRRAQTQLTGFNALRRVSSYTHPRGTKDLFALCNTAGLVVFNGTPFSAAARWQVSSGYVGIPINAVGTVGAVPFVVDDFERVALGPYTLTNGTWSISALVPHSGLKSLLCVTGAVPTVVATALSVGGLPLYPVRGHVFEFWQRWDTGSASPRVFFGYQDSSNFYAVVPYVSPVIRLDRLVGGVQTTIASGASTAPVAGNWYRCVVEWGYAGVIRCTTYNAAGVQQATCSASDTSFNGGGIAFRSINVNNVACNQYWDDFVVTGRAA